MLHPVKLLTGAVGGLSSPAGAMVMADWTLETLV